MMSIFNNLLNGIISFIWFSMITSYHFMVHFISYYSLWEKNFKNILNMVKLGSPFSTTCNLSILSWIFLTFIEPNVINHCKVRIFWIRVFNTHPVA